MTRDRRVTSLSGKKVDARVAELAARQWGVVDVHELHALGLSDKAIWTRVGNGHLHQIYRGVYAVGHANLTLEGRFLAAVKACGPDAVLSHYAAAVLWGLVQWFERFPDVTAPTARRHAGILTHRSANIDCVLHRGVPVTSPLRTLIDLASMLPYDKLRRAVNEALNQGLIKPHEIITTHHRGAKQLRKILATAAPTRNEYEDALLALLDGLPKPVVNGTLRYPDRTYIPDYRWPDRNLILEADSRRFHEHILARTDDAKRDAFLAAEGERGIRVTWAQMTTAPLRTRARIEAALLGAN